MAEGNLPKRSGSHKKEIPPMYQSEDFLRVKKQLVEIGGGELLQDITMMIKYGMEVKQASRGTSEKKRTRPNWEISQAAHEKEKRRRLQILSQPSTLLGAVNHSSIRATDRLKAIFEASASFNAQNSTENVKSIYDKADLSQIIGSAQNKNESVEVKEMQRLPKLSKERKVNQARLHLLGDLEKSAAESDSKAIASKRMIRDEIESNWSVKPDSEAIGHTNSKHTYQQQEQHPKNPLTIAFIEEAAEESSRQRRSPGKSETLNAPNGTSGTESQSRRGRPSTKLSLKDRRLSESSAEQPEHTIRSPQMPTNTHKMNASA